MVLTFFDKPIAVTEKKNPKIAREIFRKFLSEKKIPKKLREKNGKKFSEKFRQ